MHPLPNLSPFVFQAKIHSIVTIISAEQWNQHHLEAE